MAGCVIIPAANKKRAESQKTAFARACALQPLHRVHPKRARIIRGRAFDPRLRVRPIACARLFTAFAVVQKPQQRKTAGKTALPGDGSQLRPWPPSAPRLARCACECVRARWAVAVFAFDIFPYIAAESSQNLPIFSRVCMCGHLAPLVYIYLYIIYIYLRGGAYYARA